MELLMRRAWLLLALGACSAEIAPDTYFCGPEALCPEGLTCNGVDNICTVPSQAQAFDCDIPDRTGDDAPAMGLPLGDLTCVSGVRELKQCLFDDDPGDWFQFDVPDNCNAVQIEARLTFPIAFEPVGIELSTEGGAPVGVDTPCEVQNQEAGQAVRCFQMTVANGSHHAIGLVHSGIENCDGACAHNRYTLNLQLSTP
jgi:hypothetical protein